MQQDSLDLVLKYGKASNKVGKYESESFINLPYGVVKIDLPNAQKSDDVKDIINVILQSQFEDFEAEKQSGNDLMYFLLWIKEQQEFIYNVEEQNLKSDPEPELISAGIHRLNEFGEDGTLESIAKDWNITPDEVREKPYHVIYRKMKKDKITKDIEKTYQKIVEEKAKRKR